MTRKRRLQNPIAEPLNSGRRGHGFEQQHPGASRGREAVEDSLTPSGSGRGRKKYPLTGLVGSARSGPLPDERALSEHHDEVLAEAYAEGWRSGNELVAPPDACEDRDDGEAEE